MIVIKETQQVDGDIIAYFTEQARKDYLAFGEDALEFINASYKRWFILVDNVPVALAGLHKRSFIGRPELWLLLFNTFRVPSGVKAIKIAAGLLKSHHPDARMRVKEDYKIGIRFAEYLGFHAQRKEGNYIIYEDV